jgi:hypothetical protein
MTEAVVYLSNEDPRPMMPSHCRDSFDVKVMLSILSTVEYNYDARGER